MKLLIFDFEVFKHDTLLGVLTIQDDGEVELFQTWDTDEMIEFYNENKNSIWIGHNNSHYDNLILQAVVRGENPKQVSDDIIVRRQKKYLNIQLYHYDLMSQVFVALKVTEAYAGKKISESEVDFNLDRALTESEKLKTESYNFDDLDQTLDNFIDMYSTFELRLNILAEYNFPLTFLHVSGSRIAGQVLKAKRIHGIENKVVKPKLYKELSLDNEELKYYFLSETFMSRKKLKIDLCGVEHTIGIGGIHAARLKYIGENLMYFDVSGYYNNIMINFDLLARTVPPEGRALYKKMFDDQLELKKTDPKKRIIYKIVLLSVFGSTYNKWTDFYDPYHFRLITMTGQLFLVDLLEKLEGKIELVQSNTDGIIAKPLTSETEIRLILREWEQRTGFSLDLEIIDKLIQRDVNNYIMLKDNKVTVKGEAVKNYGSEGSVYWSGSYHSTEPNILDNAIVDYYLHEIMPEETIEKYKRKLTMFQYVSRKNTFDRLELETVEDEVVTIEVIQGVNRSFASKEEGINRMIYKCKDSGKTRRSKVASLPPSIFIYNDEINSEESIDRLMQDIDYDYYVKRSYERIAEFMPMPVIKKLKL